MGTTGMEQVARSMFVNAIINATGFPYIYGSNGPESYDCSGLIVACMRKRWPDFSDTTAAGLHDMYRNMAVLPDDIQPGCLLFYNNFGHVVACIRKLSGGYIVLEGANGGTPLCTTIETAFKTDAMVGPKKAQIIAGQYKGWWESGYCGAVDPFKDEK